MVSQLEKNIYEQTDYRQKESDYSKFSAYSLSSPYPKTSSPNKTEKKNKKNKLKGSAEQYIINPQKIMRNEDTRQFMMIKNIPNSFTQDKLLSILEAYVKYEIEFFYLPLDKTTGCNLGYGYVSLVNHHSVLKLYNAVVIVIEANV